MYRNKGQTVRGGSGSCDGERNAEHRIRAQLRFVSRAVHRLHERVDLRLLRRVFADESGRDLLVDVVDSLEHALAEKALLVAVAQFERFMLSG